MKNKWMVQWFVLVIGFGVCLGVMGWPVTRVEELESRLATVSGRERLDILVELTGQLPGISPVKVLEYGQEAIELLGTIPDERVKMTLYNNLASACYFRADLEMGHRYTQTARSLAIKLGDKKGEADSLVNLGNYHVLTGNYMKAREYLAQAHVLYEGLGEPRGMARSHFWNARIYRRLNDLPRALEHCFKANKIYKEINDKLGIADVKNITGLIYWELEDYSKALVYLKEAQQLYKEINDPVSEIKVLNNIGLVYSGQQKSDLCLEYLDKALAMSKEKDLKSYIPVIISNMADEFCKSKEYREAITYFHQALELVEASGEQRLISEYLIKLGSSHVLLREYDIALVFLERALPIAQEFKDSEKLRDIYKALSGIYEERGQYQAAFNYYMQFKEINDELYKESDRNKIGEMQTTYELDKKEKEIGLLKKNEEIQQLELEKQSGLHTSIIVISLLIIVLAFIIYARYRLKSRVTAALTGEVDKHKLTMEKLQESEEKFRELAEKSVIGICIIQDLVLKYVNPRILSVFGYPQGEVLGQNPLLFVYPDDRQVVKEHINSLLAGVIPAVTYEFRGINRDGNILYIESHGTSTNYGGKPALLGTMIDITERKKTEAELIKSMKLESIGILAGDIAHDFNNLLAIIKRNISDAREDVANDPTALKMMDSVEKASHQAADLANKLITFSEGGWLEPEKVFLSQLVKETAAYFPGIVELKPIVTIPTELNPIRGDRRQLRKVIHNLVQNADEATADKNGEERKVTIDAVNIFLGRDNDLALTTGHYVKLTIADNGHGIPRDQLEKIFDPYYSTKDTVTQKGMGLGLAICYSIIKKHNGRIEVQSEILQGTTVNIYLPAYLAY